MTEHDDEAVDLVCDIPKASAPSPPLPNLMAPGWVLTALSCFDMLLVLINN